MRTEQDIWRYRSGLEVTSDLAGFSIEALDGGIGKVDESTLDTAGSFLVVDTGPWIFGKKVMLPGGVIDRVDYDTETVFVNRTKDEIKNAPEFDEDNYREEPYRTQLGNYYGLGGHGYRKQRSSDLN
jgi:hypothetical protein